MITPSLNQELDLLGWRLADGTLTLLAYQSALADLLRRLFNCSAVSLWRVAGVQETRTLDGPGRCQAICAGLPCTEMVSEAQLTKYLAVLTGRRVSACAGRLNAPILQAVGAWCGGLGAPRALLAALVAINGQSLGVLICYRDKGRWAIDEATTLRRLGARVALHLTRLDSPGFGSALTDDAGEVPK